MMVGGGAGMGGKYHTPHIPNPWSPKHADELTGRATIITDRNHITQRALIALEHLIKHIHQAIGRRPSRKYHNLTVGRAARDGCHLFYLFFILFFIFFVFLSLGEGRGGGGRRRDLWVIGKKDI